MAIKIENKIVGYSVKKPEDTEQPKQEAEPVKKEKAKRPEELASRSFKLKNGAENYNLYVVIGYLDGKPYEIFFNSTHQNASQWVGILTRLASMGLQEGTFDLKSLAKHFLKVQSSQGYFAGGDYKYVDGIVQHVGKLLLRLSKEEYINGKVVSSSPKEKSEPKETGQECPECHSNTLIKEGGCTRCTNEDCGYMGECG